MQVPILTYHGVNVAGNEYAGNDHVAFAADLELIHALGLRIVPAQWLVDNLLGRAGHDLRRCVVLTCDDGSNFDYYDLDHPEHGSQRSAGHLPADGLGSAQPGGNDWRHQLCAGHPACAPLSNLGRIYHRTAWTEEFSAAHKPRRRAARIRMPHPAVEPKEPRWWRP